MNVRKFFIGLACINSLYMGQNSASVIQYFLGNNYANPAEFSNVQSFELTAGALGMNPRVQFKGSALAGSGSARTSEFDLLTYCRAGARAHDRVVVGLNVSRPYYADENYALDSILQFDSTQTIISNVDISPQISVKVLDNLSIGVGFNANDFYDFQVNFVVPGLGNVTNKANAWSFGWNVGAYYKASKRDHLSAAYFSRLSPHLAGTSAGGVLFNNNFKVEGLRLPATTFFSYTRILKLDFWSLALKVYFSQWSADPLIVFKNVVSYGTINFPVKYRDTWAFELNSYYQINRHWGVFGGAIFDMGAAKLKTRTVAFPTDNAWGVAIGGNYQIAKEANISLMYARAFYNTELDHPLDVSFAQGNMKVRANVFDLRFTYKF